MAARTKKVTLFIVEGPTDEDALSSVLKKYSKIFIPADKVIFSTVEAIQYFDDRIESAAPDSIVDRNKRKSQVLRRLHSTNTVSLGITEKNSTYFKCCFYKIWFWLDHEFLGG